MSENEYNRLIKDTLDVGDGLIFEDFNEKNLNIFQTRLSLIVENGYKLLRDKTQLKTCCILGSLKTESFRLTFIQQIFFSDGKETRGKVNAKNTDKQIKKRYIPNVIRHLPILIK